MQLRISKPANTRLPLPPKHASWLNQIEIWLSILTRKLLRRGSYLSVAELTATVLAFIEYYNRTSGPTPASRSASNYGAIHAALY